MLFRIRWIITFLHLIACICGLQSSNSKNLSNVIIPGELTTKEEKAASNPSGIFRFPPFDAAAKNSMILLGAFQGLILPTNPNLISGILGDKGLPSLPSSNKKT